MNTTSITNSLSVDGAGQPADYVSPLVSRLESVAGFKFKVIPACRSCPLAQWFRTKEELKCFCTRMHAITWSIKEETILECDGQILALMQLQQQD